jgi:hypothetical protein
MKPILKLYRGYANEQELLWDMFPPTKGNYYDFLDKISRMRSIIKLFQLKTWPNASVNLIHNIKSIPKH